jgi:hypothetical protein
MASPPVLRSRCGYAIVSSRDVSLESGGIQTEMRTQQPTFSVARWLCAVIVHCWQRAAFATYFPMKRSFFYPEPIIFAQSKDFSSACSGRNVGGQRPQAGGF